MRRHMNSGTILAVFLSLVGAEAAMAGTTSVQMLPPQDLVVSANNAANFQCATTNGFPKLLAWDGVNSMKCLPTYVDASGVFNSIVVGHGVPKVKLKPDGSGDFGGNIWATKYIATQEYLQVAGEQLTGPMVAKLRALLDKMDQCRTSGGGFVYIEANGTLTCKRETEMQSCTIRNQTYPHGSSWPGSCAAGQSGSVLFLCSNGAVNQISTCDTPVPQDPCASSGVSPGTSCADGSVYAGTTFENNVVKRIFTTRCDVGQTQNGSSCSGPVTGFSAVKITGLNMMMSSYGQTPNKCNDPTFAASNVALCQSAQGAAATGIAYYRYGEDACRNLSTAGGGWSLPNPVQLNLLYTNRNAIKNFNTSGDEWTYPGVRYWTTDTSTWHGYTVMINRNFKTGVADHPVRWHDTDHQRIFIGPARCVRVQ